MCLNLNLKPKYDLYMYQNFVLHIFELHRYAWFHVRTWSIYGSEKVTFCKNCRIQRTRQEVALQIFWRIEIVSMDPKSIVQLSGDHFEYSDIYLKWFLNCFFFTSLVKAVDIKLFFMVIHQTQVLCPSIKAWFIQLMSKRSIFQTFW